MKELNEIELDALREFTSVGTSHAATALSKLLDRQVAVSMPEAKMVEITKIPEFLGGGRLQVVGLYFRIHGDINGSILLFFDEKQANKLINILMADFDPVDTPEFEEMRKSAMMELGNIITNSYLNALAQMMDMSILLSVPNYATDELSSVLDFLLIELSQAADQALMMNTVIKLPDSEVNGSFIMFPDAASLDKIFAKIGV